MSAFKGHSWETKEWGALERHADVINETTHLRDLMKDGERCKGLVAEYNDILLDYSRQRMTAETKEKLLSLANAADLPGKMKAMFDGDHINLTEDRAVMHVALRAPEGVRMMVDGKDVVPDVRKVVNRINEFAGKVRSGEWLGAGGKELKNVVSIGIGGSYLGPEFVSEALRTDGRGSEASAGRTLRFLANVDPVDVSRALEGLDPGSTLVIVVSKTFTTAETMLNARTLKRWLVDYAKEEGLSESEVIAKQMIAASSNVPAAEAFGIDPDNVFGFWDWVGGRYSVCSAVGVLPLTLQYGAEIVNDFLMGAHDMDDHFKEAPLGENLPVLMGLLGVWNSSFLKYPVRALLPYSQALLRFPAHIQQVDMESNGKRVAVDGTVIPFQAGEINFGEPGTNGQHSFYQLIHQGRPMPCDFVGSIESQNPVDSTDDGEPVSNHDELMSNFFAQPDALANGKTKQDLKNENVPEELWDHKEFPGNRPSLSLLFPRFDAYYIGQLLALYEHRTAVQGFVWGIPSFDQWGVELGKVLAKQVRNQLSETRKRKAPVQGFNPSTKAMLERYLSSK